MPSCHPSPCDDILVLKEKVAALETWRYREYHLFDETGRLQLDKCRSEIVLGPAKLIRWGVARWPGGFL
jgi:hypothetical protein